MQRSTGRILTTHMGDLQRPAELSEAVLDVLRERGKRGLPLDELYGQAMHKGEHSPEARDMLRDAVRDVVRRQVEAGIDIVDDGEFGKTVWMWYVRDRFDGIDSRDWALADEAVFTGRDREEFAEFYAWADTTGNLFGFDTDTYISPATATQPVVTGPIRYRPEAVQRDIANLREALTEQPATEAFLPVVAPASIEVGLANEHYTSRDDLMRALADAIREEYKAIIDAGIVLQVDDAWVPAQWDRRPELDLDGFRRYANHSIDVLNHALDGLPEDRIRYHICWGSWRGPHKHDVPLADIIDIVLRVRAGGYSIEAANPRHEHEYHLWEDVSLPDGKLLIPGVVSHSTNIIEHPELIAERIARFTDRVGRENVIASTDCGFGGRIHPELGWAKLAALAEGAKIASKRIWKQ